MVDQEPKQMHASDMHKTSRNRRNADQSLMFAQVLQDETTHGKRVRRMRVDLEKQTGHTEPTAPKGE